MKSFVCSLCHNGILGGGLYLDSQSLTYKTNSPSSLLLSRI